jgi:WD40 repeat protein
VLAALPAPSTGFIYWAAFSPDAKLLATASQNNDVYLWDISNHQHPTMLSTLTGFTAAAYSAAFSGDGRILVAGSADHTARIWDVSDPTHPASVGPPIKGPVSEIYSIALDQAHSLLAVSSIDNTIWLWGLSQPAKPAYLATLTGPTKGLLAVTFSPDGLTLAAGGHDRIVRLWKTDPEVIARWICATVGQSITDQEWSQYVPSQNYAPPCR